MGPVMGGAGRCMRAAPGAIPAQRTDEHTGVCLRPPRRRPAQREAVGRQCHGGCVSAAPELAPVRRRICRLTSQACTCRWGTLCAQNAVPHSCEQRSGRSHPPTTAPQHYARSAQSHDRSIVRLLNRGSCSGRALLAAARSSCFRVNPPPPLSPPVCSWRGGVYVLHVWSALATNVVE